MHSQENKLHREREKCIFVCEVRRGAHFAFTTLCLQFKLCIEHNRLGNCNYWTLIDEWEIHGKIIIKNFHRPTDSTSLRCWFGIIGINCWTRPSHGTHTWARSPFWLNYLHTIERVSIALFITKFPTTKINRRWPFRVLVATELLVKSFQKS